MRKVVFIIGLATYLLVSFSVASVLAQGNSDNNARQGARENRQVNVCDRVMRAWEARLAGYERAKEVRKKAFERTQERRERLFDKLDELGVDTKTVRADAAEVKSRFEALLAADDALMAAEKKLAEVVCAKEGVAEARRAVETAQKNRREARKAYNSALKTLHTDLAKLRPTKTKTSTETEND